ncbi:dihydrofolate reductase [Candidatus Peregrinibacteria bacterium]|nr:dihydrofolate reductase [Candidatus Peregrinibacteria bacterium]
MENHEIYIIVAVGKNNGIGKEGKLPWHFKKEIKYFKEITTETENQEKQNMVIMGRNTWESIKPKYRPLKDRKNIVLTRNPQYKAEGAETAESLEEAVKMADEKIEKMFIIGGEMVFNKSINDPDLTGIYLTRIKKEYECDTYFPKIPERFNKIKRLGMDKENGVKFEYFLYKK